MRTAARLDANHAQIVAALRKIGCTVQSLAAVGRGCPDLLVGRRGLNYLLEVKDGAKPPSAQSLTAQETVWHCEWMGRVSVVTNVDEAIDAVSVRFEK